MRPLDHLPQTSWELGTAMVTDFRALLSMTAVFIMEATDMLEQGSGSLWLIDDNPEPPVALEVSLLCLQVVTFPDSLRALEMYLCARRNYAVPLLKPCSCLSPVCDHFSVDSFPGGGFCALRCASTTLLASTESPPPRFRSLCTHWLWRKQLLGRHRRLRLVYIQVKGEGACEIHGECLQLRSSCSHHGLSSFSPSPSSHSLSTRCIFFPQLTCQFFKMRIIFPKYCT